MKKLLAILFFVVSVPVFGTKYYVATTGSDSNPGTISEPFATWQKLNDVLNAGDTAYIRGGTWTAAANTQYQCRWNGLQGTASDTIKIWAYPGEEPIWDFAAMPALSGGGMQNFAIQMNNCNYVWVRGLTIKNFEQQNAGTFIIGWNMVNSQHNRIENVTVDHIGGNGFTLSYTAYSQADAITRNSSHNLFLNCDALYCTDPYSNGENANGWNLAWDNQLANVYIDSTTLRGCRAYHCSDDGVDMFGNDSYPITFENVWCFHNGYDADHELINGNGNGFKLGRSISDMSLIHQYTLVNCVAAHNKANGFDQNVDPGSAQVTGRIFFYNCMAYDQYIGFSFYEPGEHIVNILRNNVSYDNGLNIMNYDDRMTEWYANNISDHNSFDTTVTVTDADFTSVDHYELENARKSNGDLPDIDFGHVVIGSDLKEAGTTNNGGYPYDGAAPDIGVYWAYIGADEAASTPDVPTVTTHSITSYNAVSATLGCTAVDSEGTITERGICWSTSINPSTSDSKVYFSASPGTSSIKITTLKSNTTYHIRGFATNESGTAYGSDVSFTTPVHSNVVQAGKVLKYNGKTVIVK